VGRVATCFHLPPGPVWGELQKGGDCTVFGSHSQYVNLNWKGSSC